MLTENQGEKKSRSWVWNKGRKRERKKGRKEEGKQDVRKVSYMLTKKK
jgi:hypothetical protein